MVIRYQSLGDYYYVPQDPIKPACCHPSISSNSILKMKPKGSSRLLRKLPRELIGRIVSYTPLSFKLNVFTALGLPQWKTQESYIRLWTTIFKSDDWLLHVIQKYSVKPVLIGLNLPSIGDKGRGDSKESFILLKVLGQPICFEEEEMQLFLSCLREYDGFPTIFGLKLQGGITLDMSAVGGNSESESDIVPAARRWKTKLFDLDNEHISTYYSFYGSDKIQHLRTNDIKTSEATFDLKLSHKNEKLPARIRFSHYH